MSEITGQVPTFAQLDLIVETLDDTQLPAFCGSELRGMLRQGLDLIGGPDAPPNAPAPFTVTPAWLGPDGEPDALVDVPAGTRIDATCTLFAPHAEPTAAILAALCAIGEQRRLGRGRQKTRFRAEARLRVPARRVRYMIEQRMAALGAAPGVELLTRSPLALRRGKEMAESLGDAAALLVSIRHRASFLTAAYGQPAELPPLLTPEPLQPSGGRLRLVSFLRRGRKKRTHKVGGLVGRTTFLRPAPDALRALVVGEQISAGRWTQYGLGRYGLAPAWDTTTAHE